MKPLSDRVLDHLWRVTETPESIEDRYEILSEIGRGGMGVVYRARDNRLGREVAVKVLDGGEPEAEVLAALEHPGIVPVHDAGVLPDGRSFYVMQLVRGKRLDQFLDVTEPLSARLRVFLKICETVSFAHSRNLVHRDLKPQNIMVGSWGEVFVMDWGIATTTTGDDTTAGTPDYAAPESVSAGGLRVDIFSLGRLLRDVMRNDAPKPLLAIANRASAASPEARYESASLLAADILNFLDRLPVTAYRENVIERFSRFAGRNAVLLLLLASYVLVRVGLFFVKL